MGNSGLVVETAGKSTEIPILRSILARQKLYLGLVAQCTSQHNQPKSWWIESTFSPSLQKKKFIHKCIKKS